MKDTGKLPLPEPILTVRDLSVTFVQGGQATHAVKRVWRCCRPEKKIEPVSSRTCQPS